MATNDYDAKKYVICAPYHGPRGPAWTRKFEMEFLEGLRGRTDDYCSLHRFLIDQNDPGGLLGPPHAGNPMQVMASQNARLNRADETYAFMLKHIEVETMKDEMRAMAAAFQAGALAVPAAHRGDAGS